jgi:cytochrome c-type biogenesis protein CcmH
LNRIAGRLLAVILASIALACGGQKAPDPKAAAPPAGAGSSAALPPGHPPIGTTTPPGGTGLASADAVAGTIALSAELEGRTAPGDVLYVIARKDGSTVAVQRIESPSFPLEFEISGKDAMGAGTTFAGPVDLVARLSRSGDAIASAGDLEGSTPGVAVPSTGVSVTIETVRQ